MTSEDLTQYFKILTGGSYLIRILICCFNIVPLIIIVVEWHNEYSIPPNCNVYMRKVA